MELVAKRKTHEFLVSNPIRYLIAFDQRRSNCAFSSPKNKISPPR